MDSNKINPIHQYEPGKLINPIHNILEQTDRQTVITKNNIGNVVADKLYVRVGGYELYAPIDDTIAIDNQERTIFVFAEKEQITPANEREYLLIFEPIDAPDIGTEQFWMFVYGRQEAFNTIVNLAEDVDLHNSHILAETTKLKDIISLYSFVKMCIDKELVDNPNGFDYTDYSTEIIDDIEEEE